MACELTQASIAEVTELVFGPQWITTQPCEAIFVFGGSHPGLWEKTAEAYFKGLGKEMIVTGGCKRGAHRHPTWKDGDTPEARVIRRELIALGVPENRIYTEDRSTNTLENVLFAREVFDFSIVNSILAVCKSYGVGRQCRTLAWNLGANIKIVPYAFDTVLGGSTGPVITRDNWMNWEESRSAMLDQVFKIYRYAEKGHLTPVASFSEELLALIHE